MKFVCEVDEAKVRAAPAGAFALTPILIVKLFHV